MIIETKPTAHTITVTVNGEERSLDVEPRAIRREPTENLRRLVGRAVVHDDHFDAFQECEELASEVLDDSLDRLRLVETMQQSVVRQRVMQRLGDVDAPGLVIGAC